MGEVTRQTGKSRPGTLVEITRGPEMRSTQDIEPFSAPIAALNRALTRFADKGMIIGGVAASLLGTPRASRSQQTSCNALKL